MNNNRLVTAENADNEIINVIKKKINSFMLKDVEDILNWRYRWRMIKSITETLSQICLFSITILSFGSGYFSDSQTNWGFFNGLVGAIGIGLGKFSSYAKKLSKKKTEQVNKILESYDIDETLPEIMSSINDKDTGHLSNHNHIALRMDNLNLDSKSNPIRKLVTKTIINNENNTNDTNDNKNINNTNSDNTSVNTNVDDNDNDNNNEDKN